MTKQIELSALSDEQVHAVYKEWLNVPGHANEYDLIKMAARAAIAKHEEDRVVGEPVAWMWEHVSNESGVVYDSGLCFTNVEPTNNTFWDGKTSTRVTQLFAAPPAPLVEKALFDFTALEKAMTLASQLAGFVGMNDTDGARTYSNALRAHLSQFLAAPVAQPATEANAVEFVHDPKCRLCAGRGYYVARYSGRADDGNAPEHEECDCWIPATEPRKHYETQPDGTVNEVDLVDRGTEAEQAEAPILTDEQALDLIQQAFGYCDPRHMPPERMKLVRLVEHATQPTASPEQAEALTQAMIDAGALAWMTSDSVDPARVWWAMQGAATQPTPEAPHCPTCKRTDGNVCDWCPSATQPTASNAGERHETIRRALVCFSDAEYARLKELQSPEKAASNMFGAARIAAQRNIDDADAVLNWLAALASKPPAGEQKPVGVVKVFGWNARDGFTLAGALDQSMVKDGDHLYTAPQPEQVAQDTVDADRYRWLRQPDCTFDVWTDDPDGYIAHGGELDRMVDAARARGEGADHG